MSSSSRRRRATFTSTLLATAGLLAAPRAAEAFCGFYVGGADGKLFNDATQVVLMREGSRTVLSMQNDYKGPIQDFAMVVPVPVVLQKENVKTLPRALFEKVDALSAPRLVEYWEQDPCPSATEKSDGLRGLRPGAKGAGLAGIGAGAGVTETVKIEAQFEVGEYEIVILSAQDSSGLDTWLRNNKYRIPDGAEPALRPYVSTGSKFFVAKVNAAKVKFEGGRAQLSPLRFHYDTETFQLPVKLGMLNSAGTQDLIVHVLAPGGQRYGVANYPEAVIPTNLDVAESARGSFASFYAALFDKTLEATPNAVVTEYAWGAQWCDPCPGNVQGLTTADLASLGADVLPSARMGPPGRPFESGPRGDVQLSGATGGAGIQDLDRVVASTRGRLRACYQSGLASDPSMSGSLELKVTVAPTGEVSSVEAASNKGLSANVVTCATSVARRAHFTGGGSFAVKMKFVLQEQPKPPPAPSGPVKDVLLSIPHDFVLTRLHTRYASGALASDLVFKAAPPLFGGREHLTPNGQIERGGFVAEGAATRYRNEFQARYAIRHPWTGPITCEKPTRGVWGGPWPDAGPHEGATAATKLAYAPRDKALGTFLTAGAPDFRASVRVVPSVEPAAPPSSTDAPSLGDAGPADGGADRPSSGRCGCDTPGGDAGSTGPIALAVGLAAAIAGARRARRR
ncbi:MAG: DUF2330 domain-containing protein [Myxococcales bacterium]|jgi:hypothetical protein|nr:DUF2330 domain-containing protein [Myxococcales bacterium]